MGAVFDCAMSHALKLSTKNGSVLFKYSLMLQAVAKELAIL